MPLPLDYLGGGDISVNNNEIHFEVINFSNAAEVVAKERDRVVDFLTQQTRFLNNDIERLNSSLENIIRNSVKRAKLKFSQEDEVLSKLGNKVRPQ